LLIVTERITQLKCSLCALDVGPSYAYAYIIYVYIHSRSQWPRGLKRRSAATPLLRSWVRIPSGAWMFVCCECCALSGRGLCDELITRPEESYRLWFVTVCDLENLKNEEVMTRVGSQRHRKKKYIYYTHKHTQYVYNRAYKRVNIHAATANTVFMAWLLACTRQSDSSVRTRQHDLLLYK